MDRRNRGKGGKGGRVEGRRRKRGISKREIVRDTEKSGRCWEHREGQGRVVRWAESKREGQGKEEKKKREREKRGGLMVGR